MPTKPFLESITMSSFDVQNLFGVDGKVVLITGGSRGIGKMVRAHPRLFVCSPGLSDVGVGVS